MARLPRQSPLAASEDPGNPQDPGLFPQPVKAGVLQEATECAAWHAFEMA